jgi:hypothetical protein
MIVQRNSWQNIILVEDDGLDSYWREDDSLDDRLQLMSFENEYFEDDSLAKRDRLDGDKGIDKIKRCNMVINRRKINQYR